jgi:hypothetical protein
MPLLSEGVRQVFSALALLVSWAKKYWSWTMLMCLARRFALVAVVAAILRTSIAPQPISYPVIRIS